MGLNYDCDVLMPWLPLSRTPPQGQYIMHMCNDHVASLGTGSFADTTLGNASSLCIILYM